MSEAAKRLVAVGETYAASEALQRPASEADSGPTTTPGASVADMGSIPPTPAAEGGEPPPPSSAQPFPDASQPSPVIAMEVPVGQ